MTRITQYPLKRLNGSLSTSGKNLPQDAANFQKETLIYSEGQWTNFSARKFTNFRTGSNKSKRHELDNTAAYKLHGRQSEYYYYAGCEGKHGLR
jgi:hypothetical protein